jgi:CubicO group peptidase (beta-lactamase class C family)
MPTGSDVRVSGRVDGLVSDLFGRPEGDGRTLALLVRHEGAVVAERYGTQAANDFQPELEVGADSTLISWSMAKSLTHAAVGILVRDGLLDPAAPAPVPGWVGTEKHSITLLDLLEMRSGLHFVEDYVDGDVSNCIEMLFGDSGPSHAAYAAGQPLDHPPGEVWNYSSGTSNVVARIIGDCVAGTSRDDPVTRQAMVADFLRTRLFEPVGMTSAIPKFDAAGDFVGSSYVYATARDFARFGELYVHDGVTRRGSGERILPEGWLDHARTQVATDPETGFGYGRHWWLWPDFPGSLACHGYEGQYTLVLPSEDLVLVHLGKTNIDAAPRLITRLGEIARAVTGC